MTQWGLDNLFNPGKRHMDDEKRRLQSTREEVGDNSGGRRIDLEAGKVSIAVRRPTAADTEADDPAEADAEATALAPALEAEDVPAVALANDEAEIVPDVVDDTAEHEHLQHEAVESVAAVEAVAADAAPDVPPAADAPVEAPGPEPVTASGPRRRQLSASAWSRRG